MYGLSPSTIRQAPHASPATRSGPLPQQALYGDNNHSALQSASHVPENRAEKRGDSHLFWFFGEELFFAEKWGGSVFVFNAIMPDNSVEGALGLASS